MRVRPCVASKEIVLLLSISELLAFGYFLTDLSDLSVWNIWMKLHSNVYEVKTACRV